MTSKLPDAVFTLAETLKQHGGHSAMFTGVPTSFAAFGFDRGWDEFHELSPVLDQPATEPLTQATDWLVQQINKAPNDRHLLLVHLRGGHPPWDLSREETASLPPEEYAGMLDPRRGGIILAELRAQPPNSRRRMRAEDWIRLRAMQDLALKKQDQELSRLIDILRQKNQWERTLFVFAADVSMGEQPEVPFGVTTLSEDRLLAPLIIKFPGELMAGRQMVSACSSEDITRTASDALDLPTNEQTLGINLQDVASGWEAPGGNPQVAVLGNQFSTRWGQWMMLGEFGTAPRLCQLDIDPSCVRNVFDDNPMIVNALWRVTFEALSQAPRGKHQVATLNDATKDALMVWGE
jgi:arylsulfatase A-like enzyme